MVDVECLRDAALAVSIDGEDEGLLAQLWGVAARFWVRCVEAVAILALVARRITVVVLAVSGEMRAVAVCIVNSLDYGHSPYPLSLRIAFIIEGSLRPTQARTQVEALTHRDACVSAPSAGGYPSRGKPCMQLSK